MKLEELAKVQITVGTKSLMRRLNADEVQEVFLADDADLYLKQKVTTLRTPGKKQDLSLFAGRKGRSLPQPHNLFLF